jgi:hypothetical protein
LSKTKEGGYTKEKVLGKHGSDWKWYDGRESKEESSCSLRIARVQSLTTKPFVYNDSQKP